MDISSEDDSTLVKKKKGLFILENVLLAISCILTQYTIYYVFMIVPNEKVMGPVQRIFYFHVGSAITCYVSFGIVFFASVLYLKFKDARLDYLNKAAGEVGFVFCSITLFSGMIWGHAAWNTWFNWEPRLVTFLLLWLIFLSFNLLQKISNSPTIATQTAVIGILGALTVPLVWISVKFLPQFAQLHPQVVENRGLKDSSFITAMVLAMTAMVVFQFYLLILSYKIHALKGKLDEEL
jgi:heme exporter protein C